jgi:phospholipid/cholesterol/gamma-HCH transport system substrate-binding protein
MADDKQPGQPAGRSIPGFAQVLIPRSMGIKVGMLIAFVVIVIGGFAAYVLFSRGVFEQTQRVILIADNAEGVRIGMNLTFAGFPVGTVRSIRLREDGKVRISVRVPVEDAKWLRTTSVFILDVPLVGAAKLRAFSSNLKDPPLEHRAERPVLRGDTAEEIPRLVASVRQILENLDQITASGSSLQESIRSTRVIIDRMAGKYGVLGGVLGSDANAQKIIASIDRANKLLASLDGVALRMDTVLSKADRQVLGPGGVVDETQKAVAQVNSILGEVRTSLKRVDGILADAQAVATNTRAATADLQTLRAEVEASLRRVSSLIDEINRKWPFERDTKMKLP